MTDPNELPTSIAEAGTFPTVIVDGIAKAVRHAMIAEQDDLRAALKAWGDLRGLADRAARVEVRDTSGPLFAAAAARRTILIADTAHYGKAEPGPVDVDRHERTFAGKTYSVALLHRDEAAKLPASAAPPEAGSP